jgi:hypothetical protein
LVSLASRARNEHTSGETDAKKINNAKARTSDEDERLRELVISNASVFDVAADLGRTVVAVRARAHALRIALGHSRFRVKAKRERPRLTAERPMTLAREGISD